MARNLNLVKRGDHRRDDDASYQEVDLRPAGTSPAVPMSGASEQLKLMKTNIGCDPLLEMLCPERLTAVVDIGANSIDGPPPYQPLLDKGLCTVTGFEPQPDALAELIRKQGPQERYLPYAVGDGSERTLYVCRARGMTSLLAPDSLQLALFNDFSELGHVEHEVKVNTVRLDDVDEIERIDFLKIDIQGSELEVLKSGQQKLAQAVAIQTEVSFITLYRDQPALGLIDTALRAMGFVPHCFVELKRWPIAPAILNHDRRVPLRQLLEADILYVRDFSRCENMNSEQWKHLAMIAHHCYGSIDLVLRAVSVAARMGALPANAPEKYLHMLKGLEPSL